MSTEETMESRKATALRLMSATAARDRAAVSSCLSEDTTWWIPQSASADGTIARPLIGRDAVVELLCGETRFFRSGTLKWEIHHVLGDNDFVLVHATLRATTAGGRDYENHYAMLQRFDGELVAEAWEHLDTAYAFSRFASESG
jgi:ketosteroid isomerase-like protein